MSTDLYLARAKDIAFRGLFGIVPLNAIVEAVDATESTEAKREKLYRNLMDEREEVIHAIFNAILHLQHKVEDDEEMPLKELRSFGKDAIEMAQAFNEKVNDMFPEQKKRKSNGKSPVA